MRYILEDALKDLSRKMVFIGGPRQVGKTTLAKHILAENFPKGLYLNWDFDDDRRVILDRKWTRDVPLVVLDEIHKYRPWKAWLKGLYDVWGESQRYLVTGSARLDIYRKGGDSMAGRYHYWRLHPFSLDEYPVDLPPEEALSRLMRFGGFPEMLLLADERESRRWRRERIDRVIREDVRDLESVRDIGSLLLLVDLLRQRVGGLVAASNLAGDLKVSPKTVQSWIEVLERMYLLFTVRPYTRSLPRAVLKSPKVYFYDNADVIDPEGPRFENLVATTLLKRVHYLQDREGYRCELRYLRDKEGREVDFVVLVENEIEELVEVKYGDDTPSSSLRYFADRLRPRRSVQIVWGLDRPFDYKGIRVTGPLEYCREQTRLAKPG